MIQLADIGCVSSRLVILAVSISCLWTNSIYVRIENTHPFSGFLEQDAAIDLSPITITNNGNR